MCRVVVSRRCARTGRQQSWVRYGEYAGHHRGLRAGHVSTRGTRERGRALCLLDHMPGLGDRVTTGPGVPWSFLLATSPEGTPRTTEAGKVSGNERHVKDPEMGRVAVVAAQSTGEGGEVRPTRPTGGKAPSGSAFNGQTHERDSALTNRVTRPPLDCIQGQQPLCLRNRRRAWRTSGSGAP